jgi:uncharacterized protein YjbI with pentapeptide repeats
MALRCLKSVPPVNEPNRTPLEAPLPRTTLPALRRESSTACRRARLDGSFGPEGPTAPDVAPPPCTTDNGRAVRQPANDALRGLGNRVRKHPGLVALAVGIATLLVLVVVVLPPVLADEGEAENDVRSTLLQALAGLVLAAGLYFTAQTLRLNRESAERTSASAARTYELQREGQITERFTRAIDQLGDEKLDVRLGGIYALERIAKSSIDDHGPIMEVLTAYVREHAPWPPRPAEEPEEAVSTQDREPDKDADENEEVRPSTDVQAVIAVLGRREISGREEHKLDLSSADLKGARFAKGPDEGNFEGAILRRSRLEDAKLEGADLMKADLTEADLRRADLTEADLRGAYLEGANLEGAILEGANLEGAIFLSANLAGSRFMQADLTGAYLREAVLTGAHLTWANLTSADLRGANLRGANLTWANLTQASFVEANLTEPDGLTGAKFMRANLTGANLEGARLEGVLYDSDTKWPSGFDLEAAGLRLLAEEQQVGSRPRDAESTESTGNP